MKNKKELIKKFLKQQRELNPKDFLGGQNALNIVKNNAGCSVEEQKSIQSKEENSGLIEKRKSIQDGWENSGSIAELNSMINSCMECGLGKTRTKFVFGVGNPNAGLLLIGEAPGRDEDLKGEPFVGRAGKLLDDILAAIKLDRTQVYIANILKCRPPGNRDPQPAEIACCEPYLLKQIELIKPKLILVLGRIAAQTLLRTSETLGQLRQKIHDYHGTDLAVTYHPAALLRNPQWKRPTWEDVQNVQKLYLKKTGQTGID